MKYTVLKFLDFTVPRIQNVQTGISFRREFSYDPLLVRSSSGFYKWKGQYDVMKLCDEECECIHGNSESESSDFVYLIKARKILIMITWTQTTFHAPLTKIHVNVFISY